MNHRTPLRRFWAALAISTVTGLTTAQAQTSPAITPGDAALRPSRIRMGTDSFRIASTFGGQTRRATMVRSVSRVRDGGREMLVFAQRYFTEQGVTVDTSWLDAQTLAPQRYFADVHGEIQQFHFDGTTIEGMVTPRDSASRGVSLCTSLPFFNAVALDLIYQSLPLGSTYAVSVSLYNPPRAPFTVSLRVTGEEDVMLAAGGTVRAWVVDYILGPNTQKLWLDRETGDLLKIGASQGANHFYKYRFDLEPPISDK